MKQDRLNCLVMHCRKSITDAPNTVKDNLGNSSKGCASMEGGGYALGLEYDRHPILQNAPPLLERH